MVKLLKLVKLLLGVTLLLVLIVAVTAVAALLYLDPNDHKDFIVRHVEKSTGRTFAISGDIKLSYYPWLGVEVDGITLGNAQGFGDTPFLHAKHVALRIKTMPLLNKHYELDTFKLHGLQLHLAKNKEAVTNWSDLVSEKKESGTLPFAAVVLGGVDVKDGQISWQDAAADQTIKISDLNMITGELIYGAPINLTATMKTVANRPALNGDLKLNGTLNYNLDTEIYALKPIELVAHLSGKSVPGGATDLIFNSAVESNLKEDTVRIEDLMLEILGISVRGGLNAVHVKSGKPQVAGELAIKGKDMVPLLKLIESPAASDLERVADRTFDLKLNLDADLQADRVQLPKFEARLFGASIKGNVEARDIQSGTPATKGMLKASGPDLPALLQLAGQFEKGEEPKLAEYGRRLARSPDRAFDVAMEFDADPKSGNVQVPTLSVKTLGFSVNGQVVAKDMNSDKGKVDGKFSLKGEHPADVLAALDQKALSEVLQMVSVDTGVSGTGGDVTLQPLRVKATFAGKQIPNSPAEVMLNTDTQFNLKKQTLSLRNLSLQGLGVNVTGDLSANRILTETPAVSGKLDAKGGDLALLFKLAGIEPLATQLSGLDNRSFDIKTGVDADLEAGTVKVSNLDARLLGAVIQGQVDASNIQTKTPSAKGKLKASGPDLPALLQLAGQFEKGEEPKLAEYGRRLARSPDRAFDVAMEFDADPKSGNVQVPTLSVKTLGFSVNGQVVAKDMNSDKGKVDGKFSLKGEHPADVLAALDQKALSEVLQMVSVDTGVSGTGGDVTLQPLRVKATFAGKQIPNSPAEVMLNTDTQFNLKKQTLSLRNLSLQGLGVNVTGDLSANRILTETPAVSGKLDAKGGDLALLFKLAGIEPLATQLSGLDNRSFDIKTGVDADLEAGTVKVSNLDARLLGAVIQGQVDASNIQTKTPSAKGKLKASGPDLPALLQLAGQFEKGEEPKLAEYGRRLARSPDRAFDVAMEFDADPKSGNVQVPTLSVKTLGFSVNGQVVAKDMNSDKGKVDGKFSLKGEHPADVLAALDQKALSEVLQMVSVDTGVSGTGGDVTLQPLRVKATFAGKQIPNSPAEVMLNTDTQFNLKKQTLSLRNLSLQGLGVNVTGDLSANRILTETPAVSGKLDAKGGDLALLFKLAGIEPLATQLSGLDNRSFDIKTGVDADLEAGTVKVSNLDARLLGAVIQGQVDASNIQTKTPSAKGKLKASGPDLPALLQLAGQFEKGEEPKLAEYGKRMAKLADKSFDVSADFDADVEKGNYQVRNLSMKGVGVNAVGDINASRIQTDTPAVSGKLDAKGSDLAQLLKVAGIEPLATQLAALDKRSFDIKTGIDADLGKGTVKVSNLDAHLLGAAIQGQVDASNIKSQTPSAKGKLKATGPDLPALLQLAGQFQGEDSALNNYGERLAKLADKSFDVSADFDADPAKGNYHVPVLAAKALGVNLNGQIKATAFNSDNASVDGKISLQGDKLSGVLTALDQGALGEVLQSVKMDAGVKGQGGDIVLSPLQVKAAFAGKQIPNSPVDLTLSADTRVNLEKQTLSVRKLVLQGLGLNVTGNLSASKIKEDIPEFSGDLDIAEFNLRRLAQQLNQKLPETADKNVLSKVALKTVISGSKDSLNVKELTAQVDESVLNGNFSINHFTRPDIKFALDINSINADRYLPPVAKDKQAAPVTPESAAAGVASEVPLDTLRSLQINGVLEAGQFILSNAKLNNIKLVLRAKDGDIRLDPASADLYQGKYQGSVALDVRSTTPVITVNSKLSTVHLEPLLQDYLQQPESPLVGIADVSFDQVTGRGMNAAEIKSTLTGTGDLKVIDGILRGVDINKALEQVEIMIESKTPGKVQAEGNTSFKQLTGTLDIKNGVVTNKDLLMLANGFTVTGAGMLANLNDETIKYDMKVNVDETKTSRGEANYNIGGYQLPVRCRGKVQAPDCKPDAGDILNVLLEKTGKEKLESLLNESLGVKPKKTPAPTTETAPQQVTPDQPATSETQPATEPAPAPAPKKKKKKKSLEEQLLEGLLN